MRATTGRRPPFADLTWLAEEQIFDDRTCQAVFVETLSLENLAWARRCLDAGKHVLIDKPPTPAFAAFRALLEDAESRGLHTQVAYQYRYLPAFEFALDWARSGRLGRLFRVRAYLPTQRGVYERWYPVASAMPGGVMHELGSHMVDLVVSLLGRPDRVTSVLRADNVDFGRPPFVDNAIALLEYPGVLAEIDSMVELVDATPLRHFGIHGTRGSVIVEPLEPDPTVRLCLDEARDGYAKGWQEIPIPGRTRDEGDVEEFVAVVCDGRPPRFPKRHELLVEETLLRACGAPPDG